jgi:hypothetical protein
MQGSNTLTWLRDVSPASWLAPRLHSFAQDVGSIIPEGFAHYARVFHPVQRDDPDSPGERWSEIARRNGRIVHAEMQLHEISKPLRAPPVDVDVMLRASVGSLPLAQRRALVEVLLGETSTPERIWFCLWDGFSLDDQGVHERVTLPGRSYLLYGGDSELAFALTPELGAEARWRGAGEPQASAAELTAMRQALNSRRSPSLWWPDDRAWCVATEVDFAWTYVGGSTRAIARVLTSPKLEALPARLSDSPLHDSDRLNAALDGA